MIIDLTGQKSIPLYDKDARLMKVKDKGQIYKKMSLQYSSLC